MWCRHERPRSCGSHLPHDHGGSPCLPSHHPRSHKGWRRCATPTRSAPPRAPTCSPTWPPSPTRGGLPGAATRWPASWGWPPPRCWPAPARWPRSPSGPLTRPRWCAPRWAPAAMRSPASGRSRPSPPSAAPWAASTTRHWRWRSAPGWPTVTGVSGGSGAGGRSRSTARPCAAPAAHPTAARSTCSPRWTTPPARCWPNARSTVPPAKFRACGRCWPASTSPAQWPPPTRCTPVNLAAALRHHARDPARPLATLGITPA